jgi:hypothetical protein
VLVGEPKELGEFGSGGGGRFVEDHRRPRPQM